MVGVWKVGVRSGWGWGAERHRRGRLEMATLLFGWASQLMC